MSKRVFIRSLGFHDFDPELLDALLMRPPKRGDGPCAFAAAVHAAASRGCVLGSALAVLKGSHVVGFDSVKAGFELARK